MDIAAPKSSRWMSVGRSFHFMIIAAPRHRKICSSFSVRTTGLSRSSRGAGEVVPPSLSQLSRALVFFVSFRVRSGMLLTLMLGQPRSVFRRHPLIDFRLRTKAVDVLCLAVWPCEDD